MKFIGRILCFLGFHAWTEGYLHSTIKRQHRYCKRCPAVEKQYPSHLALLRVLMQYMTVNGSARFRSQWKECEHGRQGGMSLILPQKSNAKPSGLTHPAFRSDALINALFGQTAEVLSAQFLRELVEMMLVHPFGWQVVNLARKQIHILEVGRRGFDATRSTWRSWQSRKTRPFKQGVKTAAISLRTSGQSSGSSTDP